MHGKNRFKLFGRHTEERKKHPVTDRESAVSAAARWGMSKRRVLQLCAAGKVYAAKKDASGRWTIPVNAIKPVDGRRYLGVSIPRQLIMAIEKADTTVAAALSEVEAEAALKKKKRTQSALAKERFLCDAVFHMHVTGDSSLTYADIREIVAGRAVAGKRVTDQFAAVCLCEALKHAIDAAWQGRRLSMKLIREICGLVKANDTGVRVCDRGYNLVRKLVRDIAASSLHPVIKAGKFFTGYTFIASEGKIDPIVAFVLSNFMLMRAGYPPIVLWRGVVAWRSIFVSKNSGIGEFEYPPSEDVRDEDLYAEDEWGPVEDKKPFELDENGLTWIYDSPMGERGEEFRKEATGFASLYCKAIMRSCRVGFASLASPRRKSVPIKIWDNDYRPTHPPRVDIEGVK